jgi:hypothetical protein
MSMNMNLMGPSEALDPTYVQTHLINKWSIKLKEEKKAYDSYLRHVSIIKDSFREIQNATGITDIDEIVTTFVKAEE